MRDVETSLQSNAVSHWLGVNTESALALYHLLFSSVRGPISHLWTNKWNLVKNVIAFIFIVMFQSCHNLPYSLVSQIVKRVWLFTQWAKSADPSFICCNRYSVKHVFYLLLVFLQILSSVHLFRYVLPFGTPEYVTTAELLWHVRNCDMIE